MIPTPAAAERFHLKPRTFMEKVREHAVPYVDTGRGYLFTEAALIQLQEALTKNGSGKLTEVQAAWDALEAAKTSRNNPGNVYFIGHGNLVKIGFARDVQARLATLQTGAPEQLVILHSFVATERMERKLHAKFKSLRVRGEWFKNEGDVKRFIKLRLTAI